MACAIAVIRNGAAYPSGTDFATGSEPIGSDFANLNYDPVAGLATFGNAMVGTTAAKLVGFHGTAATAQRASANQAAVVNTASTQTTPFGFSTNTQADAIVTLVNEIRTALINKGLIKGSA